MQQALRLSEEDSSTIDDLNKQLERSYAAVEAAAKREEDANRSLERSAAEVAQLSSYVEKSNSLLGSELTLEDVLAQREALGAKLRQTEDSTEGERRRGDALATDLRSANDKGREMKAAMKELERKLTQKEAEEAKEARRRATIEADLQKMKDQLGAQSSSFEAAKRNLADSTVSKNNLATQLEQQRSAMASTLAELHALQQARIKLSDEIEEKMKIIDGFGVAKAKTDVDLRQVKDALSAEQAAHTKSEHKIAALTRDVEGARKDLATLEQDNAKAKSALMSADRDLTKEQGLVKSGERTIARLDREKTVAEKAVAKEKDATALQRAAVDEKRAELKVFESQMSKMTTQEQKLKSIATALDRERERLQEQVRPHPAARAAPPFLTPSLPSVQVETLKGDVEDIQDQLRSREGAIKEAEKAEHEAGLKVKHMQSMYESMRADRNAANKALMEAQDEMAELKRKGKVQSNQIEALKEDVHVKDRALVAEQFEASSLTKQLQAKGGEMETFRRLLEEAAENNHSQESEMRELNGAIKKQDSESVAQKRAFDAVIAERDILASQLQKRNDELALLYEKATLQQRTMKVAEKDYNERIDESRMHLLKVAELKRELMLAQAGKGSTEGLRLETNRLSKDLAEAQNKVRALSAELENPLNVHRWRKLEGADPSAFELVQKVHMLQKRLIAKTEEAVEKDAALVEKTKAVADFSARLSAIPGSELGEQLTHAQALVNERTRQLKALASEVNMYQAQIAEYKFELERAAREMVELKRAAAMDTRAGRGSVSRRDGAEGKSAAEGVPPLKAATATGGSRALVMGGGFVVGSGSRADKR